METVVFQIDINKPLKAGELDKLLAIGRVELIGDIEPSHEELHEEAEELSNYITNDSYKKRWVAGDWLEMKSAKRGLRDSIPELPYYQQWSGLTTENHLYNIISNDGSRIIDVNASFDLNPQLEIPNNLLQTRRSTSRRKGLTQQFKEDAEKLYNAVFAIENDKNLQSE
jgi:hypothetical protein